MTANKNVLRGIVSKALMLIAIALLCLPAASHVIRQVVDNHRASAAPSPAPDGVDEAALIEQAQQYNDWLAQGAFPRALTREETEQYNALLNPAGTGVMGRISIPKINVDLPICHGMEEDNLQIGAGHMAGTSLPVISESSHVVLAAHRGLPLSDMFTELHKLEVGDTFVITTLHQKLTYEVDQIQTVLPEQVDAVAIEPGEEYCTLVTCTPLGINTHRLLVRGHRVKTADEAAPAVPDRQEPRGITLAGYEKAMLGAALLLLIVGFIWPWEKDAPKDDPQRQEKENA